MNSYRYGSVWYFVAFLLVSVAPWSSAGANLLTNGSFEDGPVVPTPPDFVSLNPPSTAITGWTVTRAQIDYIGTSFWQHADGIRSLDLDGTPGRGGVAQTFATEVGVAYLVTFDLASSPGGNSADAVKRLGVEAAGQSQEFTFDSTGRTRQDMGWQTESWNFTANSNSTTLELFSLATVDGSFGPALDNVSVTVVPEPAGMALWGLGWIGSLVICRGRRSGTTLR